MKPCSSPTIIHVIPRDSASQLATSASLWIFNVDNRICIIFFQSVICVRVSQIILSVVRPGCNFVLKSKVFCLRSKSSKKTILFCKYNELQFIKKWKIVLSKLIFYVKINDFFFIFNLGDHFLLKHSFMTSIFEPLYFLKSSPFFDELTLIGFAKQNVDLMPETLLFKTHHL